MQILRPEFVVPFLFGAVLYIGLVCIIAWAVLSPLDPQPMLLRLVTNSMLFGSIGALIGYILGALGWGPEGYKRGVTVLSLLIGFGVVTWFGAFLSVPIPVLAREFGSRKLIVAAGVAAVGVGIPAYNGLRPRTDAELIELMDSDSDDRVSGPMRLYAYAELKAGRAENVVPQLIALVRKRLPFQHCAEEIDLLTRCGKSDDGTPEALAAIVDDGLSDDKRLALIAIRNMGPRASPRRGLSRN